MSSPTYTPLLITNAYVWSIAIGTSVGRASYKEWILLLAFAGRTVTMTRAPRVNTPIRMYSDVKCLKYIFNLILLALLIVAIWTIIFGSPYEFDPLSTMQHYHCFFKLLKLVLLVFLFSKQCKIPTLGLPPHGRKARRKYTALNSFFLLTVCRIA